MIDVGFIPKALVEGVLDFEHSLSQDFAKTVLENDAVELLLVFTDLYVSWL